MGRFRLGITSFGTKVMLVLIIAMLFTAGVSDYFLYSHAWKTQFGQLRGNLITIAKTAALTINVDALARVPLNRSGIDSPYFKEIEKELLKIKEISPDITYVYTMTGTGKKDTLQFVVDLDTKTDIAAGAALPGDEYDAKSFPEMQRAFITATADKSLGTDLWGAFLSGYAPIRDKDGNAIAILGVDMKARDVYRLKKDIRDSAVLVIILAAILSILLGIFLARKVTGPINKLVEGTRNIAKGNLDYDVEIEGNDEIAELGKSFTKMSHDLKSYIDELQKTTAHKERLLKELEIARGIQQSFLPEFVPEVAGFQIAAASFPARQVGGDFYDFIPIEGNKIGLVIADVSGKGVPAALYMALSRTLLRASIGGKAIVGEAIKKANDVLMEDSKAGMFVTLFYGVLDSNESSITYVNAGHNPPIIINKSDSTIKLLKAQGVPLGMMKDKAIPEEKIILEKGNVLVLYTDGVTEAINAKKEQFEIDRLSAVVEKNRASSAHEIMAAIEEELKVFTGNEPQFDDITLMVLKVI